MDITPTDNSNSKYDNYYKILNTISLIATSVIVFFIYLSLNDKLSDVKKLTVFASDFFEITNDLIIETKPQVNKMLHDSIYMVNTTQFLIKDLHNVMEISINNTVRIFILLEERLIKYSLKYSYSHSPPPMVWT